MRPDRIVIPWQKVTTEYPFTLAELEIDLAKTALLIVDLTNVSLGGNVSSLRNNPHVMPNNIRLLEFFRQRGLGVLFCAFGSLLPDARDRYLKSRLSWMRPSLTAPTLLPVKGSGAYQVRDELKPLPSEPVIDKNCQGAFNGTSIETYLLAGGVQNLVVTGMATSHCVEATARDAADHGYNVILVDDACADPDRRKHDMTMQTFGRMFGAVKSTDEVIKCLS